MTNSPFVCGLAVRGPTNSDRQLVRYEPTLNFYADGEGEPGEAYLSHFVFGPEMREHFGANGGSPAGFAGPCAARHVVLDIDRPNLNDALADCRKLVQTVLRRYPEIGDDATVYFSGNKGFHVLVELAHRPAPAVGFHRVAKTYCEGLAALAGVAIDGGIYDLVRIVRLPNTQHPKSGLFKRRVPCESLFKLGLAAILDMAKLPSGDGIPVVRMAVPQLALDWATAEAATIDAATTRAAVRVATGNRDTRVPKFFMDFLRLGTPQGERHITLFRVAAWMIEQGAGDDFTRLFLTEAAGDLGLPPENVARQIDCGVGHVLKQQQAEWRQSP